MKFYNNQIYVVGFEMIYVVDWITLRVKRLDLAIFLTEE
jgi:hypothetical protein